MPTTINGIGTHYYGKRHLVKRPGYCENCKTYHRRQSAGQNPSVDLDRALGAPRETNRINFLKPSGE